MVELKNKESSHRWWFDSHNKTNPNRSLWLQATLSELDEKTITMLKIIEEDADSFAQRAEMYYKKRPELVSMMEEFYRNHRSLAERYDHMKAESGICLQSPWSHDSSPLSFTKYRIEKSLRLSFSDGPYDSYSEACGPESDESEIDDPEVQEKVQDNLEFDSEEVSSADVTKELIRVREAAEKLEEENRIQKEQLMQKDEEKREVIRQLSLTIDLLRVENEKLMKSIAANSPKKESYIEFNKLKQNFLGRLFSGFAIAKGNLVAL